MSTLTPTRIRLETACNYPTCSEFAFPLHKQLSSGAYDLCSVMALHSFEDWRAGHRTARKRADRAARRGYRFVTVNRHERTDELYAINTSTPERQGRPMSSGYQQRPSKTRLPDYPCVRHGVHPYGVETVGGVLVAYLWLYRAGELGLVSQILGHADHLENEVMYLLVQGVVGAESRQGGFLVYNRHDSGTDGLRFFKERVGFAETKVEWCL